MSQDAVDFTCRLPEDLEDTLAGGLAAYDTLKDTVGRFRTRSLFVEYKHDAYPAPFTLQERDTDKALSMYRLYMEIGDPTEYTQAIALLGSWKHWLVLCQCDWFPIENWRLELRTKMESDRFLEMQEVADKQKGTTQGVSATKWLADRYGVKPKTKRGRPSKEEKAVALKEELESKHDISSDAQRLGIVA